MSGHEGQETYIKNLFVVETRFRVEEDFIVTIWYV